MGPRVVGLVGAFALAACGVNIGGDPNNNHVTLPDSSVSGSDAAMVTVDAAPDAPIDARPCTDGTANATDADGNCFELFDTVLEWQAAETACESLGAHLAIVKTAAQNTTIASLLGATPVAYLGGTDVVTEGTWLWTDTTGLWLGGPNGTAQQPFTNWNSGEPNNGNGTHQEDCITISSAAGHGWDDRPCAAEAGAGGTNQTPTSYPYVCQR